MKDSDEYGSILQKAIIRSSLKYQRFFKDKNLYIADLASTLTGVSSMED